MSERGDLVAIYGAIDEYVKREPERLAPLVSDFLVAYEDPKAVGWFDDLKAWSARFAPPFPEPLAALERLATPPESGRLAARRLLVMAALHRVAQATDDSPDSALEQLLARTLQVDGIARTPEADEPTVFKLVTNPDFFGSINDWAQMINAGVAMEVLDEALQVQAFIAPCTSWLVDVLTPGDPFPATELRTSFFIDKVTLAQASEVLEPSNWPGCDTFWVVMQRLSEDTDHTRHYHEVVSLDRNDPFNTWTAEAYLRFKPKNWTGGASVTYGLEPGIPNPQIDVDQGGLFVKEQGTGVVVDTTKRIRFTYPFNGPSLSVTMCALGYADQAEELVLCCARNHGGTPSVNTPSSGGTPSALPTSGGSTGPPPKPEDDAGARLKQTIDECMTAYKASYDKIQARKYKPDDFVSDMASSWRRYVRGAAAALELALKATTACGTAPCPPSGGTPSGGTPSGGTPSGGTPSGGTPSGGTPSGGTPSGGTPSGGTPSGGTPPHQPPPHQPPPHQRPPGPPAPPQTARGEAN
jgi:hypothetical protein